MQTKGFLPSFLWIEAKTISAEPLDAKALLLLSSRLLTEVVIIIVAIISAVVIAVVAANRAIVDIIVAFKAGWASFVDGSGMRGLGLISQYDCN